MENAIGTVFRYGDNVDTDVIIPARYLNSSDPAELATHCMEDIDTEFVKKVKQIKTLAADLPVSMHRSPSRRLVSAVSLRRPLPEFSTAMRSISDFRSLNARKQSKILKQAIR